jgi:hypothetical protein
MAYTPNLLVNSGVGVDNLFQASDKINENFEAISTEIDDARAAVVEWTNSVITQTLSTPPGTPTEGDRYIVKATGLGDWAGHDNDIAEYDGEDWVFTEPVSGSATIVDDETIVYVFSGSAWVASRGALHNLVDTTNHPVSGLTTGHVLRATSATAYGFGTIAASSLSDATATPTASKIPIADGSAKLDGWITTPILASEKAAVSGVASLDSSSKVVQDPANATATPTASKIPIADGSGKLAAGWGGSASTLATLDSSSKVVQDPANATSTKTASKIPIADSNGYINTWVQTGSATGTMCAGDDSRLSNNRAPTNHNLVDTVVHPVSSLTAGHVLKATAETTYAFGEFDGDKLDVDWNPTNYTPTIVTETDDVDDLSSHLKGIDLALTSAGVADNSITLAKLDHGTQGDILYYTTDGAPARLGTGDSGQALLSGGSGANPSWQTVATSTIVTITAGENLALNDIVYVKTSDGKYYKADKDAEESADAVGITLAIISQNATGDIAVGSKLVTNVVWSWTPGSVLYLSGTQGAITATLPTTGYVKPLGYAITATQILFMPLTGWPVDSGASTIDGDKVVIDFNPTNTTPTIVTETDTIDQLSSHLKGLDLFAGTKAAALGLASLDSSSKVVQEPANATATPTASKIPIADGSGKLAAGWGGAASTIATLDSNSLVVQNPANATVTQAIAKIPISDTDGTLDSWITPPVYDIYPDQFELDFTPLNYINTPSPSSVTATQIASHLQGIDNALKAILARLDAHSI